MFRNKTYPVLIGLSYWIPLANSATPINAGKKRKQVRISRHISNTKKHDM